jgi:3-oxoacyl-[acyl-carrier-protein] synthase II
MAGERGFSPVEEFDLRDARCRFAGRVAGLDVRDIAPRAERDAWSRTDALALLGAREALESARLPPGKLGLSHAGTTGAMLETERDLSAVPGAPFEPARALRFLTEPLCATTERLARTLGATTLGATSCAACASSAIAIVQAMQWVRSGRVDAALAGGADGLCALTFFGFESLGALDPEPCRPFDVSRRGLSLGEAGAFLVLESEGRARARGAPILAFLSGAATGAEAHHITHPEPSGARAAELVERALRSARLGPSDIDYVNAHGTGTQPNDRMEAKALLLSLGDAAPRVSVSSSKAQLGHTLGAAGAVEAAITVLGLIRGDVPPTVGLVEPEEPRLSHVVSSGRKAPLRAAMSCSFGFGGTGAVLVFERADRESRLSVQRERRVVLTGVASFGALGRLTGATLARYLAPEQSAPGPYEPDPATLLDPSRSRRFDRAAALVTVGAESALAEARLDAARSGLVVGTAFGSVQRSVRFVEKAASGGPRAVSPAEFPHLVVSASSGNASVYLGLRGPVLAVSDRETSAESALATAVALIEGGQVDACVAGGVEAYDSVVQAIHPKLERRGQGPRGEGAAFVVVESEAEARARKAPVLARLEGPWSFAAEDLARELEAPATLERAVVVTGSLSREHELLLDASTWGPCTRRSVLAASGQHEAAGGFALGAAAALVAAGRADEALAVGGLGSRLWVTRLSRASDD